MFKDFCPDFCFVNNHLSCLRIDLLSFTFIDVVKLDLLILDLYSKILCPQEIVSIPVLDVHYFANSLYHQPGIIKLCEFFLFFYK